MKKSHLESNYKREYVEIPLPDIVERYNTTYHQLIRCTPSFAREPLNYQQVFEAPCGKTQPEALSNFKVSDRVRIVKKDTCKRLFTVNKIKHTNPPTYSREQR